MPPLIVVGPRRPEEVTFLKDTLGSSIVVALLADLDIRRGRWATGRAGDEATLAERDFIERAWGLDETLDAADVRVDTERPLEATVSDVLDVWHRCSTPSTRSVPRPS